MKFVETDSSAIINNMISVYENSYLQQTGTPIKLKNTDRERIFLYTIGLIISQILSDINWTGNQNLLESAIKQFLDGFGNSRTVFRMQAQAAYCTVEFTFSIPLAENKIIPSGTRVTAGDNVFFATQKNITAPAGSTSIILQMSCLTPGAAGNNYAPGALNILVDPLSFVENVSNIDQSQGGSDQETDEQYRARIQISPEGYAVAGPELAYEYKAREFDPLLLDVKAITPSPGVVNVIVLGENGTIPDETYLSNLLDYLGAKDKRPLTDKVTTSSPAVRGYSISLTYYLNSNINDAPAIQRSVDNAVSAYKLWQQSKIGRNIDPSELIRLVKNAGASRVVVTSPIFTEIDDTSVAVADNATNIIFGGFENE